MERNKLKMNAYYTKIIITTIMILLLVGLVNAADSNKFEYLRLSFEEGQGNIIDSSGNNRNILNFGATYTTTSKFGSYGISFAGNEKYFTIQDLRVNTGSISVSTWVRLIPQDNLVGFWNIRDSNTKYGILVYDHNDNNRVYFEYHNLSSDNITLTTKQITLENFNLKNSMYNHLVITINYQTKELKYYRDNNLIYSDFVPDLIGEVPLIARYEFGKCFLGVRDYNGFMDSTRIFNFVVNSEQVNSLYNLDSIVYPNSLLIEQVEEYNIFTIDLEDKFTIVILGLIIVSSILCIIFYSSLIGGSVLMLIGLTLLFNSYSLLISMIVLLIGFVGIFYVK